MSMPLILHEQCRFFLLYLEKNSKLLSLTLWHHVGHSVDTVPTHQTTSTLIDQSSSTCGHCSFILKQYI